MEKPPRIVIVTLPLTSADAPAVIKMAAAGVLAAAAVGNEDGPMFKKAMTEIVSALESLRPDANAAMIAASDELFDCLNNNKLFTVLGGFDMPENKT